MTPLAHGFRWLERSRILDGEEGTDVGRGGCGLAQEGGQLRFGHAAGAGAQFVGHDAVSGDVGGELFGGEGLGEERCQQHWFCRDDARADEPESELVATPVNLEPAASAVKAAASKKNKDDDDDQKRGAVHRGLQAEPMPNRPDGPAVNC